MQNYQIKEPLLLDIDVVHFEYEKGKPILNNVKKQVWNIVRPGKSQGQVVAILGPSGIGKSTLFELIAGLLTPTEGTIQAHDTDDQNLEPVKAGMVGMVYQSYDLYPFLKVRSQLELGAKKGKLDAQKAKEKIEFYLDHFRLREHASKYPSQLSGGQRQRLAIAQQLLCSNKILLMDEPFSGLDPLLKRSISDLITDIVQLDELMTIIIVSHDIEPTLAIADTVWLMGKAANGSASIVETIDMMELGFAWKENVEEDPAFQKLVNQVCAKFAHLT